MGSAVSGEDRDDSARRRRERRDGLAGLAREIRALIDAAVNTDVATGEMAEAARAVAELTERLRRQIHRGPYSGLVGPDGLIDPKDVNRAIPLSPWAGECNPIAPPVALRFEGDRVVGAVRLGKAYVGPPGVAHGGIVAGLMDQMLAAAGQLAGVGGVTGKMTVHFRRPTPLDCDLDLIAWADAGCFRPSPPGPGRDPRRRHPDRRRRGDRRPRLPPFRARAEIPLTNALRGRMTCLADRCRAFRPMDVRRVGERKARSTGMTTEQRYVRPLDATAWPVAGKFDTIFSWEYADGRDRPHGISTRRASNQQWNTNVRIDWSRDLDPENPQELPDEIDHHLRLRGVESPDAAGEGRRTPPRAGLAAVAVPARRAGRAGLHGEDRAAGAERRREVLRRDAGDGRGAARRDRIRGCCTRSSSSPIRSRRR